MSVLPLLIFVAELSVVTVCTLRTIAIARGMKWLAPALGLFEVAIWLFAIGAVMRNLNELSCTIAYAAGFSLGNFLGVFLEGKLALGNLFVRVITPRDPTPLINALHTAGYGVTKVPGQGSTGPVQIVLIMIMRKDLAKVRGHVLRFDPRAFYSVDDVQSTAAGVFPSGQRRLGLHLPSMLSLGRAG